MEESFGNWVVSARKNKKISQGSLAQKAEMSQSAINRIENNTSDATFAAAMRIIQAAESTPAEMIWDISKMKPSIPDLSCDVSPIFPDEDDLRLFETLIVEKPKTTGEWIASLLNKMHLKSQSKFTEAAELTEEQQWLQGEFTRPFFSSMDIYKFVLNYPSSLMGGLPFSSRLNYPADMTVDLIRQAYVQNAVLHIQDLKTYVSTIYNDRFSQKAKGFDFTAVKKYREVTELKEKICVPEKVANIRLGDIFRLDEEFSVQHEFFMMACNVVREESGFSTDKDMYRARKLFIMMSRYLAVMSDLAPDWLMKFRTLR